MLVGVSCQRADARQAEPPKKDAAVPAPATGTELPEPSEQFYGLYLQNAKVGWMRATVTVGDEVELGVELHAKVAGMGQVSEIELSEHRFYGKADRQLGRISFMQAAATGKVRVEGKRTRGSTFKLDVTAGQATRSQEVDIGETLGDAMTAERLARTGKVGETATAQRFDPSILKTVKVEHRTAAVETRMFAGVATPTVKVVSSYPELGISEASWLDATGTLLESQVGGFFVARLEPPEVAKRLDFHQDLLINAVVKAPQRITEPERLRAVDLRVSGFGDMLPPTSPRQTVKAVGTDVQINLKVEDALPVVPLADAATGAAKDDLEPTPFIQSDAPELVAAARRAIGDAKDVFTATSRLSAFVFAHVRDEYVPAYSNALEAYTSGRGDCTEHSILFVALARAVGIPARVAVGIAYWPPGNGFGWHAWAEVQAAGRWYTVDPTWNQPIADATHVKLADGGPAEQARIVMLLGQLKIEHMAVQLAKK